ncbi:MAG: VanZ family protein [Clostridiales bacterium]|nr:VanZ family protein [Clostridiales bacterium]
MPWHTIVRYTAHALLFAICVTPLWLIIRRFVLHRRFHRRDLPRAFTIGYLAAVAEIIGLRIGLRAPKWLGGTIRLTPMYTTLEAWHGGAGRFLYHVGGNALWFVPLGALLSRTQGHASWLRALAAGAAYSVALELMQYVLGTGMTDIDDVLLNALGALAGFGLGRLSQKARKRTK